MNKKKGSISLVLSFLTIVLLTLLEISFPVKAANSQINNAQGPEFTTTTDSMNISLVIGETGKKFIEIKNLLNRDLAANITIESLGKFVSIDQQAFTINANSVKDVYLSFSSSPYESPQVYYGAVVISSPKTTKKFNIILELKDKKPVLNIQTKVLKKIVSPGEDAEAEILINSPQNSKKLDLILYYDVKNKEGYILSFDKESLTLDNSLDVVKKIKMPSNIIAGEYVFFSKVSYKETSSVSSDTFEIQTGEMPQLLEKGQTYKIIALVLIVTVALALIFYWKLREKNIAMSNSNNDALQLEN